MYIDPNCLRMTRLPIPKALKLLIDANNELLEQYQHQLQQKVLVANEEMMKLMNLNPEDGWRLDLEEMEYVKVEKTQKE